MANSNTKKLTLALAALLLAQTAAVTACSEKKETIQTSSPDTVVESSADTEEDMDSLEARKLVSDNLPDTKFDGMKFTVISSDDAKDDFYAEEESGILTNDIIWKRNSAIRDRFDINLIAENAPYVDVTTKVNNAVNADDDVYQMVNEHMIQAGLMAANHTFIDLTQLEYLDFERPWWNQSAFENLSVGGKTYLMAGSLSPYFLTHHYCVFMNKKLGQDYQLTDTIYDTVLNGEFTIDFYINAVKDTWRDLNGNGRQDDEDFYGLAAQITSYATPFIYAFGETTVSKDENDYPVLSMNQEKFADMVNKVYDLFYETNGTLTTDGWGLHAATFLDSRALFMDGVFAQAYGTFNDFNDDFCILPYPKWDTAQQNYYTMTDGSSPLIAIPRTVRESEAASIIIEALNAESWKTVYPTYYDVIVKTRGVRDETSMEIIDIIANGAVLDFGFIYGDYTTMGFTMSALMGRKSKNFASFYAGQHRSWEKRLEKLTTAFVEDN